MEEKARGKKRNADKKKEGKQTNGKGGKLTAPREEKQEEP